MVALRLSCLASDSLRKERWKKISWHIFFFREINKFDHLARAQPIQPRMRQTHRIFQLHTNEIDA
jgi:hypothetical protein